MALGRRLNTTRTWTRATLWGVGAAALLSPPAPAQTSAGASVAATVDVLSLAPLTAAAANDLDFGTVLAGTPSTPVSLAADAGRFDLTGEPNAAVTLTFSLPSDLTGPGGTIPVAFTPGDGLRWAPYPAAFTTFDPTVPFAVLFDGTGTLTIGITGTVSPPVGTLPGLYGATITLNVEYLL